MAFDANDLKTSLRKCHQLAQEAKRLADPASPVEQALTDAILRRFPTPEVPDDFMPSVLAYADAMRLVYSQFGHEDLDIAALTADALMNTAPWKLYGSCIMHRQANRTSLRRY